MDLFESKSDEWQLAAINNNFGFIAYKAQLFLDEGPVVYKDSDSFGYPNENWSDADILLTENGCRQILEGRGVLISDPIIDIEVRGFNLLFKLFHYKAVSRKTKHSAVLNDKSGILDSISFEHIIDGNVVTYHHFLNRK